MNESQNPPNGYGITTDGGRSWLRASPGQSIQDWFTTLNEDRSPRYALYSVQTLEGARRRLARVRGQRDYRRTEEHYPFAGATVAPIPLTAAEQRRRLNAAAPDLLAACEAIVEALDQARPSERAEFGWACNEREMLAFAIAKAKGAGQ